MPSKSKKPSAQASRKPTDISHSPATNPIENGVNGVHATGQVEIDQRTGDTTESAGDPAPVRNVNRKKQKRREKEAAKRLSEQRLANGYAEEASSQVEQIAAVKKGRGPVKGYFTEDADDIEDNYNEDAVGLEDEAFYSGDEDGNYGHEYVEDPNNSWLNTSKRKKTARSRQSHAQPSHIPPPKTSTGTARTPLPTLSNTAIRAAHKMSNERIWNTSTQAERENVKQFWLELGEEDRRSLVKVEKDAVLRKMKEQQKHSCSCSVCGRKRTAIEEELEVLYDAYYEELEQFAHHNADLPESPQSQDTPHTKSYRPSEDPTHPMAGSYPVSGRINEVGDEGEEIGGEDEDEEDYEDEDDDEEAFSDDDYNDVLPPGTADFFQFGNSLTVKDGILTVADDLLKNDGKHFIDMMEQLAERRMQREEEIHYPAPPLAHQNVRQGHNHPPIDEEDDYDEDEDDDDYDSQDEDDFEGDEMDSMTEEQRMEEGRRMFQIFAARMFEQRVLTAYREKAAAERQKQLLEELEEEERRGDQREAKRAREAAKKKEKKAKQKAAKEEEKQKKESERLAAEKAAQEEEAKKQEEKRKRQEEQRKKREADKKALEDEKQRKEAEKLRRAQEERERHAEAERKQREAKDREKKKREDLRKKEREERESKEKDAKERRLKEAQERKVQEDHVRKQKVDSVKADKELKTKQEHHTRPQPIALPSGLHPVSRKSSIQSPQAATATPIATPSMREVSQNRQSSQTSQTSSPQSQKEGTEILHTPGSPGSAVPQTSVTGTSTTKPQGQVPLHHPQPSAPRSPLNNVSRGAQYPFHLNGMSGLGVSGPPPAAGLVHGAAHQLPTSQGPPMVQPRYPPNGMNYPPGFGGPRHGPHVQPLPFHHQHPNTTPTMHPAVQPMQPSHVHSRQASMSDNSHQHAPIGRPGPIAPPSSTTPDRSDHNGASVDQITAQLGSKALLDDSDEPILNNVDARANLPPVGAPGSARTPFSGTFPEPKHSAFSVPSPSWNSFAGPAGASWSASGNRPSPSWPQQPFGSLGGTSSMMGGRPHVPRPITVRLMLVQACRRLSGMTGGKGEGFHPVSAVLQQLDQLKPNPSDPTVSMDEMLQMCDTEGNVQNGGGSFEVVRDHSGMQLVRYIEDGMSGPSQRTGVGDIGSPLMAHSPAQPAPFGSIGKAIGPPGHRF